MRISDDMHSDVLDIIDRATLVNAACEKGHLVNRRALGGLYALLVDPGWGSLDWNSLKE
jgi:hypothetical protein